MPQFILNIVMQAKDFFQGLSISQKVSLMIAVAAVLAVVMLTAVWTKQPSFRPVYSGLSSEEMAEVVSLLDEKKIPYKMSADGMSLSVPEDKVQQARMLVAGEGSLMSGDAGFELFDGKNIGMTDFMQKLNFQRALQGELSRTISQLKEVENARVHIVMAKESLFQEDAEKPSASVVITLRRGRSLAKSQVAGITQVVANAVEGMEPDRVSIIDSKGNVLTKMAKDGAIETASSNMEMQRAYEKELEGKIVPMLEKAIGKGNAIVRVSALLDFEKTEKMEEIYDPDGVVVRSEQRSNESLTDTEGTPAGAPGVTTNLQEGDISASGASSNANKSSETINYEITRVTKKTVEPLGELKKLSVAVLLDGNYETSDDGTKKYVQRTDEEMKVYENIVRKIMGFNADRGDQLEISSVAFEPEVAIIMDEGRSDEFWIAIARNASIAILGILFFVFILRPLIKWFVAPVEVPVQVLPAVVEEEEAVGPTAEEVELKLRKESAGEKMRQQLVEVAKKNPDLVVNVIQDWLESKEEPVNIEKSFEED